MNRWKNWSELVDELKTHLLPDVPTVYHEAFEDYVYDLFAIVSKEELASYAWKDIVGTTLCMWKRLLEFDGKTPEISVFDTDESIDWKAEHTSFIHVIQNDTPFMVDSIRMKLSELGICTYLILNCSVKHPKLSKNNGDSLVGLVVIEIDRIEEPKRIKEIQKQISDAMADVRRCVYDFKQMKEQVVDIADYLKARSEKQPELEEIEAYLRWLLNENFTFLGFEEICAKQIANRTTFTRPINKQFGLLKDAPDAKTREQLEPEMDVDFFSDKAVLSFAKASSRSTVHRPAYPDFIIIKRFDDKNNVIGEYRILGLYTSPVFNQSVSKIPILRKKCNAVIKRSNFMQGSHIGKELVQILQVFPREELFQISEDQLFETAMSILQIQERNQTKVFMRQDRNGLFCSFLVYVPRDVYSTALRIKIQEILCKGMGATDAEFFTFFSESVLARVHFILRLAKSHRKENDVQSIVNEIIDAASSWDNEYRRAISASSEENEGITVYSRFCAGIPTSYKEQFSPVTAVFDTGKCLELAENKKVKVQFYKLPSDNDGLRAKVFNYGEPLPLSDQIPVMDNMGLKVISEHPYCIKNTDGEKFWIHDFYLKYFVETELPLEQIADHLQTTFCQAWHQQIANDSFNRLVLVGAMNSIQVRMFRAYAHYMKQINGGFSQTFIASCLYNNVDITVLIWELFQTRFDVDSKTTFVQRVARQQQIQKEILERLEQVSSLTEDRILRRYVELIMATLRTNLYQQAENDTIKPCLSFKISTKELSEVPKPVPQFEIFVYSPRFEGIHLRCGKVARGGLRWSDRQEDFRTEILGLVKAQQVKNSVIVPVGAKGGFVCRHLPAMDDRESFMQEGVACYKLFIRALLDVTDNLVNDKVVRPDRIIAYDDDDYYLVVAADKGTASFSDIANKIAAEYNFWLGDAFASGGSVGYDHKKMGITAKGAWVSVQRHFAELGVDVQKERVSVVGIGDMSGDVFGNGMLLSEKIELVAAFNHLHIFIDPNPDVEASFKERKKLFELPRSGWSDYNKRLISKGGGVFLRSAKSIQVTPEMKERFNISKNILTPADLVSLLLCAPVDLLWNGGIGTYVKASSENNETVGDHTNDGVRVNGSQLRCKVVGEGGNLGFTQLGRVEYALNGGIMNTDFIDNAAGVDCSDHEVNIKILLNRLVDQKNITLKQRERILEQMTDDVSSLVLKNNYRQVLAISLAEHNMEYKIDQFRRLIRELEQQGLLDRSVEFLPDDEELNERISKGKSLTRPEISLMISYSKGVLKEELLNSPVCDDQYLMKEMFTAFPQILIKKYQSASLEHRLKREIAITQLANYVCNAMGVTFINRLKQFTGVSSDQVLRAFIIVRDIYDLGCIWKKIEKLDLKIESKLQMKMLNDLRRSMRRSTRWMLQMNLMQGSAEETVSYYKEGVAYLIKNIKHIVSDHLHTDLTKQINALIDQDVPQKLATEFCCLTKLPSMLFYIQTAHETGQSLQEVARGYMCMAESLSLDWVLNEINELDFKVHWQVRAREASRDEFISYLKLFVGAILKCKSEKQPFDDCLEKWQEKNQLLLERWNNTIGELKLESHIELSMLTVLARDLLELYEQSISKG